LFQAPLGLTQLKVGKAGIWSFGDEVQVLHDLQFPFQESISGQQVTSRFTFNQTELVLNKG
jgi:midasin (ATPase involved in ribosome maturation)